ncbi:MAG: class I SAM-dependent methyltransferase [Pseudomonadota bacterium]|nr:class I SAM-dependent methyltransferase [Pseudomonadota bacterium]
MFDKETVSVYNKKIKDYVKLVDRAPGSALRDFVKKIELNGLVLDLGCGPGNASDYMTSQGLRVDATDASHEMINLARKKYGLLARVMAFSDLSEENRYDGVWANFSLLHAAKVDFGIHLKAINKALKSGGYFCLGMKLGTGEKRDRLGRFYAYYSRSELIDALQDGGFALKSEYMGEEKGLVGSVEPWIILQSRKDN